jgi:hypothetical protein
MLQALWPARFVYVKDLNMQYVLNGFRQESGFRVFAFQGVGADQTPMVFTVRTDLALIRAYGILVQELPLLCRALLERSDDGSAERAPASSRTLTYSEDEMRLYAGNRDADRDAARRKKSLRRIPPRVRPSGAIVMGMSREPGAPSLLAGAVAAAL